MCWTFVIPGVRSHLVESLPNPVISYVQFYYLDFTSKDKDQSKILEAFTVF